jgi:hypothetical protein
MLGPISWRTPPRHYGPWELVTSLLTEALVARGVDVTLFATADSETAGRRRLPEALFQSIEYEIESNRGKESAVNFIPYRA